MPVPVSATVPTTAPAPTLRAPRRLSWTNTLFLASAHLLAALAVVYLVFVRCSPFTLALAGVWWLCSSFAITAGYHRLFAHRAYQARAPLRAFYLFFGAAGVQNSALAWAGAHRNHHAFTDTDRDPYDATRGFWWSHVGWVLFHSPRADTQPRTTDLERDPLVRLQHRYYIPLAILVGALLPAALGFAWGDPLGALLVAGFLRLVVQWHATFSVNSFAHLVGRRPYSLSTSARDSWITALFTMGEGYHNFHHRFQADYRNGWRWFHVDPTKWVLWTMSCLGLARGLRRTAPAVIRRAQAAVAAEARAAR